MDQDEARRRLSGRSGAEGETEILAQTPPPAVARALAWLLIVIFAAGLAAAVLVRFPETVRCQAVLVSDAAADPVQSPLLGVLSAVNIVEGQEVIAGVELFRLRSDEILGWRTELRTIEEDLHVREAIASKLEASHEAEMGIRKVELARAEQEASFREKHVQTARKLLEGVERLAKEGNISEAELFQRRLDLAESEKDLNLAMRSVQQEGLEILRLQTERARRRSEDQAETEKLRVQIQSLARRLENSEGDILFIRAPFDAVVTSLPQRSTGSVVQSGAELCQLARVNSGLAARLLLEEEGLPRLAPGQRVRLFFEAFPYQRYGSVEGTLEWVSPAAVSGGDIKGFVGRARLDRAEIMVDGQPRPLRVGMRGEARIVVGSRTPIEYVFEPLRQLRENMRR
jgi:multidrug resistance efflux pump